MSRSQRLPLAAGFALLLAVQSLTAAEPKAGVLQSLSRHADGGAASGILQRRELSFEQKVEKLVGSIPDKNRSAALAGIREIEQRLRESAGDKPLPADALSALGTAYLQLGQKDKAMQLAANAVSRHAGDPQAHRLAAQVLAAMGDEDAARKEARAAVDNSPHGSSLKGSNVALLKSLSAGAPSPSPAAAAPDASRDPSLNDVQVRKIDDALVILWNTKEGRKAIVAVAPQTKNAVDLEQLRRQLYEGGDKKVKFKLAGSGEVKQGRHAETRAARDGDAEITHVILLTPETLKNPKEVLSPLIGEKLDNVAFWDQLSESMRDLKGRLTRLYIKLEQKALGCWQEANTLLGQEIRMDETIMAGNLDAAKVETKTHGEAAPRMVHMLKSAESRGGLQDVYLFQRYLNTEAQFEGTRLQADFKNDKAALDNLHAEVQKRPR